MSGDNPALDAAVKLLGSERGRELIGCDWGTKVSLPWDREVCARQARRRMVLHRPGGEFHLKVCDEHAAIIDEQTDPR